MPSVAIIDSLEQDLGVPVVTSMQAMMWAGLGLARVKAEVGRLRPAVRPRLRFEMVSFPDVCW